MNDEDQSRAEAERMEKLRERNLAPKPNTKNVDGRQSFDAVSDFDKGE